MVLSFPSYAEYVVLLVLGHSRGGIAQTTVGARVVFQRVVGSSGATASKFCVRLLHFRHDGCS